MKYTICEKCQKSISNNNIARHISACGKEKSSDNTRCKYCEKAFSTAHGRGLHEIQCKLNPDRYSPQKGRIAWNVGLTKETSEILQKSSVTLSNTLKEFYGSGGKLYQHTSDYWTPERKLAKSEWRKRLHKDKPETHPNRRLAGNRSKMTYPEKIAFDFLTECGIEFLHNSKVGNFYPDFIVGRTIIEIDGEYWHNKETDDKKDEFFRSLGYNVFRIKAKSKITEELKNILSMV